MTDFVDRILVTTSPSDIAAIFDKSVEGVLWKRKPSRSVAVAIDNFDERKFDFNEENLSLQERSLERRGYDKGQIEIEETDPSFSDLAPLWNSRDYLQNVFSDAVGADIYMSNLLVQKPRRATSDRSFHRDRNMKSGRASVHQIFFIMAHKNAGTQIISAQNVGSGQRCEDPSRIVYPVSDIKQNKIITADTHDVLIAKTGPKGTIHRGPWVKQGLRWWTFSATYQGIEAIKRHRIR